MTNLNPLLNPLGIPRSKDNKAAGVFVKTIGRGEFQVTAYSSIASAVFALKMNLYKEILSAWDYDTVTEISIKVIKG